MDITEICFPEQKDEISADDLAVFLLGFNAIYKAAKILLRNTTPEEFSEKQDFYLDVIRNYLAKEQNIKKSMAFDFNNTGFDIVKINYSSPLSFWAKGIITALVAATILSGGKAEVWGAKFEINSIGKGLRDMQEVISLRKSDEEFKERKKQKKIKKSKSIKDSDEGEVSS